MTCADNSAFVSAYSNIIPGNFSTGVSSLQNQNFHSNLRPMKRLWQNNGDEYDSSLPPTITNSISEPVRKRALYEDKMSNTLQNLNIGLVENKLVQESPRSIFDDDWGLNNADSPNNPSKIDSISEMIDDLPILSENELAGTSSQQIILTDPLKSFIDKCKKDGDLTFLKFPERTGKELILYQPLVLPTSTVSKIPVNEKAEKPPSDDIRNRIRELDPSEAELFEEGFFVDLDDPIAAEMLDPEEERFIYTPDEYRQIITFPEEDEEEEEDSANSSDGSSGSAGSRKSARAILSASRNLASKRSSRTSTPSSTNDLSGIGLIPTIPTQETIITSSSNLLLNANQLAMEQQEDPEMAMEIE